MKVKRKDLTLTRDSFTHRLVLKALTNTFSPPVLCQFMKDVKWEDKEEVECYIVLEGQKLPIFEVCERWEEQIDQMIAKKASELVAEKLPNLNDIAYDISKELMRIADEKLGIVLDEEDYR